AASASWPGNMSQSCTSAASLLVRWSDGWVAEDKPTRPHNQPTSYTSNHPPTMTYDVITFGEAMVRLAPPNFRRLEQATSLDLQVGGAELNTAVGLARLGRSTAWVSRLTRNPLGRLVANSAREAGVSTEHVVWTDGDRVGVYFLEFG